MTVVEPEPKFLKLKYREVETNGLDRFSMAQWQIVWRLMLPKGREGAKILDAGAGEHEWTCSDYDITRCDSWQTYYNREETPPKGVEDVDLCKEPWPYEDNQFDGVVAVDVLEHLENQWAFWREAFRVARGFVVIATPNVHAPVSHPLFQLTGRPWGFVDHEVRESHHITPVFRWQMEEGARRAGWRFMRARYANRPPLPQGGVLPQGVFTAEVVNGPSERAVVALFRPRDAGKAC
jgi:predicted SAM-dependent methyltransferase